MGFGILICRNPHIKGIRMFDKNTGELKNELKRESDLDHFFRQNQKEMDEQTLPDLLLAFLEKYEEKQKDVIKRSMIPASYAYQIFEGRKNCGRDKLLRIALAFPLSVAETNKMLSVGGFNDLYVRNKRDAIIMYCLEKRIGVVDTNDLLYERGEDIL